MQGERRAAEAHELDGGQRRATRRLALVLDPKPLKAQVDTAAGGELGELGRLLVR